MRDAPGTVNQALKCKELAEEIKPLAGAPAQIVRDWFRAHPKPRIEKNHRAYQVFDKSSGVLLAQGTCSECADALGRTAKQFMSLVSDARKPRAKKYAIVVYYPDD